MNMKRFFYLILSFCIFLIASCSDDEGNSPEEVKAVNIYLTDCPFEADEVNVEILGVTIEDMDGFEIELNTNVGIYNLLNFQDGVDTLLASGNVDVEDIDNIYFEIGDQNSIVVDGVTFPLELQGDNIVKVKIDLSNVSSIEDLLVDFFACTSIIQKQGGYFLKPVIKYKGKKGEDYDDLIEDLLEDFEECYDLVYPLGLIDTTGAIVQVETDDALVEALVSGAIVNIAYPFDLIDENGVVSTIGSEDDLEDLEDCDEDNENDNDEEEEDILEFLEELEDCYSLVYPVGLVSISGDIFTANDENELSSIIDVEEISSLVFPISVANTNGELFVLNELKDEDDLDDCDDDDDDEIEDFEEFAIEVIECYEFIFPISFVDIDGNQIEVLDSNEYLLALENNEIADYIYPFDVIKQNGTQFTLNQTNQLNALNDCEEDDDDDDDDDNDDLEDLLEELEDCYDLIYPIVFSGENGISYTANNEDELEDLLDDEDLTDIIYPISVLDSDGNTLNAENEEEALALLDNC